MGAHRCLIGHCCGNADPAYHRRVVDGGSYIGFDRIGILRLMPDETRADNLARLVRAGEADGVLVAKLDRLTRSTRDLATMCSDAWRWQSNNPNGFDA